MSFQEQCNLIEDLSTRKLFITFELKKQLFMKYDCNNNIQKSIISTKIKLNLLKVSSKKKILSFQIKLLIWVFFWLEFEKKLLPFSKSVPSSFSIGEVSWENKKICIQDKKCFICLLLGWNLKKPFSYLKSMPSNLFLHKIS